MNSLRFYTTPPVDYPYVMRPIHKEVNIQYKHEIVDIGIYDLLKPPFKHKKEKLERWTQMTVNGLKVVPDYPDIRGEHGVKEFKLDNVKSSKILLKKYYDSDDPSHLPVIQGYYDDWKSFEKYCTWFIDNFELPGSNWIAIGTICKAGDKEAVNKIVRIARHYFPDLHIHAFGLKMNHLDTTYKYIDSWDSMAWTFPRIRGESSAGSNEEREQYFYNYLSTISRITKGDYSYVDGEIKYNNLSLEVFL